MTPKEMAIAAVKALDSKKGTDIKVMEVTELTSLADYFVICTGGSNTQINALCDAVEEALEKEGYLRAEAGRGVFAAKGMGGTGERRETLLKQLDETVNELLFLGMTPQELAARVSAAGTKGEEET